MCVVCLYCNIIVRPGRWYRLSESSFSSLNMVNGYFLLVLLETSSKRFLFAMLMLLFVSASTQILVVQHKSWKVLLECKCGERQAQRCDRDTQCVQASQLLESPCLMKEGESWV